MYALPQNQPLTKTTRDNIYRSVFGSPAKLSRLHLHQLGFYAETQGVNEEETALVASACRMHTAGVRSPFQINRMGDGSKPHRLKEECFKITFQET